MEREKSNTGLKIVFSIVIIALLAVIGVLVYKLMHQPEPENQVQVVEAPAEPDSGSFGYDSGAVAIDEDSLQRAYDELVEKAKEGTMALSMKMVASSTDGENFSCELANAPENRYDMYMELYLDDTKELVYKSGLIPLGMEIDHFKANRRLNPGDYEATLVYVQVEDDKATVHSRLNVGLTLSVTKE